MYLHRPIQCVHMRLPKGTNSNFLWVPSFLGLNGAHIGPKGGKPRGKTPNPSSEWHNSKILKICDLDL